MKEYPIYDKLPEGWRLTKGATCHPKGFVWINNGKSRFSPEYRYALMRKGEDQRD